jgi:hypothetical protein
MSIIARLEPVVGIIRLYAEHTPPPAPYRLALVVVGDQGSAEIKALATADLTPADCVAVRRCLRSHGYHTVRWSRRDPDTGEMRMVSAPTGLAMDDPTVNHG